MILVGPRWQPGGSVGLASSGIDALSLDGLPLGTRVVALERRIFWPARLTAQLTVGADRESMIGGSAAFRGDLMRPRT